MLTYNYCLICGHQPDGKTSPMNDTHKFWDCDDGWKIGALCGYCWDDVKDAQPKAEDYAYSEADGMPESLTDEDPTPYL